MSITDILEKFGLVKNKEFTFVHGQEYYAHMFFEQILPQIEQISNQSKYGSGGSSPSRLWGKDSVTKILKIKDLTILVAGISFPFSSFTVVFTE